MKKGRLQHKFLNGLKKTSNISAVCKQLDLSRNTIYQWRNKDPSFASLMDEALSEGEDFINDMCESKLLTLIKEGKFPAIKYRLEHCHPKYKKQEKEIKVDNKMNTDLIIRALGLTNEDFTDENVESTTNKITKYLLSL